MAPGFGELLARSGEDFELHLQLFLDGFDEQVGVLGWRLRRCFWEIIECLITNARPATLPRATPFRTNVESKACLVQQ